MTDAVERTRGALAASAAGGDPSRSPDRCSHDIATDRRAIERAIEGKTLCSVFAATVARLGDAAALIGPVPGGASRSLSWNQYRECVRDAALGLHALGLAPGSFAVIMARNRLEYVIADLGVVHAGATPVGLYNTLSPEQIAGIVNHCGARVAFVEDAGVLAKFQAARAEMPRLDRIVLIDGTADDPAVITWNQLLAIGREAHACTPQVFDRLWQSVLPDDPVTLIYTSGTTGPPKAVIDSHRSALWAIEALHRVVVTSGQDRVLSYLPLAHAADRFLSYYAAIVHGQPAALCPEIKQVVQALLEVRPTVFVGVPRVWEKLHAALTGAIAELPDDRRREVAVDLDAARRIVAREQRGEPVPAALRQRRAMAASRFAELRARIGLDRVNHAITGAAPTPREVLEFFHAIGVPITEAWGMSEIALIGTCNPPDRIKIGSIGRALPGVELRLAPDGELEIRGGMVMRGYYKDPESTAAAIDAEGWLSTGDVAVADPDGYYTIVDRKKELLITSGGKNISPGNLESMLKSHPLIGQACVIGDRRPYLTALIVLDASVVVAWTRERGIVGQTLAELVAHPDVVAEVARAVAAVNQRVSRVENIRKWTILPAEWTAESEELTPTLKLKRRVIVAKYAATIATLYDDPPPDPMPHQRDAAAIRAVR